MASKLLAPFLFALTTVACGGARFSADTPVAPLQPRATGFLEGKQESSAANRDALLDQVELISAKERSVCFRATVRQSAVDDRSTSQWEVEVNDQPVVLGKELVTIRDDRAAGELVHARAIPGDQVVHVKLPEAEAGALRIYERQVAFCRGFPDGIPEEVEVELNVKRTGARDSSEDFKWQLRSL